MRLRSSTIMQRRLMNFRVFRFVRQVMSRSMQPTLEVGDRVLVDKVRRFLQTVRGERVRSRMSKYVSCLLSTCVFGAFYSSKGITQALWSCGGLCTICVSRDRKTSTIQQSEVPSAIHGRSLRNTTTNGTWVDKLVVSA